MKMSDDSKWEYRGGQITQGQIRKDMIIALGLERYPAEEDTANFNRFHKKIETKVSVKKVLLRKIFSFG